MKNNDVTGDKFALPSHKQDVEKKPMTHSFLCICCHIFLVIEFNENDGMIFYTNYYSITLPLLLIYSNRGFEARISKNSNKYLIKDINRNGSIFFYSMNLKYYER